MYPIIFFEIIVELQTLMISPSNNLISYQVSVKLFQKFLDKNNVTYKHECELNTVYIN